MNGDDGEGRLLLCARRFLSSRSGLNQPGHLDNRWVLAMLAGLRVALVQRKCVPLSISSGRSQGAAHERTPTASAGCLLFVRKERMDMAGSVNKVILIGNLGKDPEVRNTQAGDKIVSF